MQQFTDLGPEKRTNPYLSGYIRKTRTKLVPNFSTGHNRPLTKEGKQRAAAWGAMCAVVEGKSGLGLSANTAEETEAELAAIGGDQLRCYTDGGCDGNGAALLESLVFEINKYFGRTKSCKKAYRALLHDDVRFFDFRSYD